MAKYAIRTSLHGNQTVEYRRKRDSAALLFENAVYKVLKANSLLDRPVAERSMKLAEDSYKDGIQYVVIPVFDDYVSFQRLSSVGH